MIYELHYGDFSLNLSTQTYLIKQKYIFVLTILQVKLKIKNQVINYT